MTVRINKTAPTVTLILPDGTRLELSATDFCQIHDEMTAVYADNYDLLNEHDDDEF